MKPAPQPKKRIAAFALAGGLALSGLGLASPTPQPSAVASAPTAVQTIAEATGLTVQSAGAVSGTVPNIYVRRCSRITRRCTGYRLMNARYHMFGLPSRYYTQWTWSWI